MAVKLIQTCKDARNIFIFLIFFENHGYIIYFFRSHDRTFPFESPLNVFEKDWFTTCCGGQQAVSQHVITFIWLRHLTEITDILTWVLRQPTHSDDWIISCARFLIHIPISHFLKALCCIKLPFLSVLLHPPPHKHFICIIIFFSYRFWFSQHNNSNMMWMSSAENTNTRVLYQLPLAKFISESWKTLTILDDLYK